MDKAHKHSDSKCVTSKFLPPEGRGRTEIPEETIRQNLLEQLKVSEVQVQKKLILKTLHTQTKGQSNTQQMAHQYSHPQNTTTA